MASIKETLIKYDDFFGEIKVDEVDAQNSLQNYSLHASLDSSVLDNKMDAALESAQAN